MQEDYTNRVQKCTHLSDVSVTRFSQNSYHLQHGVRYWVFVYENLILAGDSFTVLLLAGATETSHLAEKKLLIAYPGSVACQLSLPACSYQGARSSKWGENPTWQADISHLGKKQIKRLYDRNGTLEAGSVLGIHCFRLHLGVGTISES